MSVAPLASLPPVVHAALVQWDRLLDLLPAVRFAVLRIPIPYADRALFTIVALFGVFLLWAAVLRVLAPLGGRRTNGSRNSDLCAYELTCMLPLSWLAYQGCYTLFGFNNEWSRLAADEFYGRSEWVEVNIVWVLMVYQVWNLLICLLIKELRGPVSIIHHSFAALCGTPTIHFLSLFRLHTLTWCFRLLFLRSRFFGLVPHSFLALLRHCISGCG